VPRIPNIPTEHCQKRLFHIFGWFCFQGDHPSSGGSADWRVIAGKLAESRTGDSEHGERWKFRRGSFVGAKSVVPEARKARFSWLTMVLVIPPESFRRKATVSQSMVSQFGRLVLRFDG
jgi:hypothetical protein